MYNVEISGELVHHVDGLLQGEAVQQLIALASTLGDGVYAPGDVELLGLKELLHRCGARSFSSVSSCTQRLNTETVRQQLTPPSLRAQAVGKLTYSLKGVFLEAESTILVCAFEMHLPRSDTLTMATEMASLIGMLFQSKLSRFS